MSIKQTSINQPNSHRSISSQKDSIQGLSKSKSGLQLMKNYLLKKAENMYKLNLSDQQAFKWKFHKNKSPRPLSSFRLIKKQNQPPSNIQTQINLQDLKEYCFPVLAHKTKQLASFATMILKDNKYFKQQFNDQKFLKKLVTQLSINYNIVSYHNFSHAFSLSLMLFQCFQYHSQLKKFYTQQERFYALIAGLAHDLNHPGTNNAFQIKMKSVRAIQFNNESVLQNFHVKSLWKILEKNSQINFLKKINNPQKVKKHITNLILMTDVAQHFKNLQKLKSLNKQCSQQKLSLLQNEQNRQFFLGQLFHACDIGNPCIDFDNYISWAALLSYEFNEQTVLQKQNNLQITQMLRYKDLNTFYKGQLGFINFMVLPLWKQIVVVCNDLKIFTNNIETNTKILGEKMENAIKEEKYIENVKF